LQVNLAVTFVYHTSSPETNRTGNIEGIFCLLKEPMKALIEFSPLPHY